MRISYEWLKEYVDAGEAVESAARLTMAGLEVEAIENPFENLPDAIAVKVVSCVRHPNAGKLHVCTIDAGDGRETPVVCGAPNVEAGVFAAWLRPGTKTAKGGVIAVAELRGARSEGMLASKEELGLEEKSPGIWLLPPCRPGAKVKELFGRDAEILEVNVTPNRPDCLSHLGIARELAAATGKTARPPVPKITEDMEPASSRIDIEILDPAACPRYLARVVAGVNIGPSPSFLVRRLEAAGVRSINNVVDATNYVMLELGQPMHAFDLANVRGKRIVVRKALDGERIVTIDGIERKLAGSDLVIADGEGPVAVAGVMGGEGSGIGDGTADILLECAYFEPRGIRRTSSRLALSSESSYRFERGVDPGALELALDRCAELCKMTAGGKILSGRAGSGERPAKASVLLRPERLAKVAGAEIPEAAATRILESLGFHLEGRSGDALLFDVPTHRQDVAIEEDLIEEVVRINGYDAIPVTLPAAGEFCDISPANRPQDSRVRSCMTALGFSETINYSFIPRRAARDLGFDAEPVAIANPLTEEQSVMRTTLLHGLLWGAAYNARRQVKALRLFEVGRVFLRKEGAALPEEPLRIAALIYGARSDRTWALPDAPSDVYDIKGALEGLFAEFRAGEPGQSGSAVPSCMHPGRSGAVTAGGREAGYYGQVHPQTASAYGIPGPVFVFEIDASALFAAAAEPVYRPFNDFPKVERDLALVVDAAVPAGTMLDCIRSLSIPEVEDARVFDIYTGAQVGEGRKNVAIGMTYGSIDRTLTDAEVSAIHERIVGELNNRFAATLRG